MRAHAKQMVFPIGQPNDAFAQYFVGQSYLAPVSTSQVGIFNVTFEPGDCINIPAEVKHWHGAALDVKLTDADVAYLEEMYVPHPVVGAINQNPAQGVVLLDEKK